MQRYRLFGFAGGGCEAIPRSGQGPKSLLTYEKSHVTSNLSHNLQQPKEESVKKRCVPAQKVLIKFS